MHDDQHNNQASWSTSGAYSPQAGRDQHIYFGATERGRTTEVRFNRERTSLITTKLSAILASLSSLATILTFIGSGAQLVPAWQDIDFSSPAVGGGLPFLLSPPPSAWIAFAIGVVLAVLSFRGWCYFNDRRRQWPIFPSRRSWRRALIPSATEPGKFKRASVEVECLDCLDSNRPGVYARLYADPENGRNMASYQCRNKHRSQFRGLSVMVE